MSQANFEILTVNGPIVPEELGITQTHEHVWLNAYDHYKTYQVVFEDEQIMAEELGEFKRRGGSSIVEVTTAEIGRDPVALREVSRLSGVHLIMGSGWYREFAYPREVLEKTSRELAEDLIREIECGVGDTGIRPGIIGEIGTGTRNILPAEERVFRAAALAQQATGLAITTHTTRWGSLALEQIAMLQDFGADLSKVIIGHLGDRVGARHLLPIAEKGVYLEVDNIGYLDYQPEWVRADNVAALVKEGYVSRILLSQDICMLSHLKYQGGNGYGYLLEVFIPMLRVRGVTEEEIHTMLVTNPARVLQREANRPRRP
jgi:phosphotriesterase-related protein